MGRPTEEDPIMSSRVFSASTVKFGGKPEVSNVVVTVADSSLDSWRKWHDGMLAGKPDEKDAVIELMLLDRANVVFRVRLEGVGILDVNQSETATGSDRVATSEIELYVESVRLEGP